MQHVIAHRVHPEEIYQVIHINHISPGFAHLAAVHQKPGMSENLPGQGFSQRHQKNGPVYGVEPDNVLSDQMQVSGPEFPVLLRAVSLRVIADARDVIGQRVQPHIHHMPRVKVHGNPPLKRCPGHTQVLQSRQQEIVHHLIFTRHRLNKFRMLVDMSDEPVRIFAHTEKIGLFPGRFHLPAAVRTFAVHQLGLRPEGLAGRTVHPFVGAFVDIILVIQPFENLLYLRLMIIIRSPYKLVIGNIQHIAQSPDNARHLVHKLPGGGARFLCLQLNLLPVLVRPCLEKNIIAFHSLEPRNAVCQHDLIIVADMRLARGIGNGCGKIVFSLAFHLISPLLFLLYGTSKSAFGTLYACFITDFIQGK